MSRVGGVPLAAVSSMGSFLALLFAPVVAAPATMRESEVLRIAVAPGPDAISNRECSGRERFCAAGLAFLSPDDTLYFYDFENDNLKVIALHPGRVVRLVPGLGAARAGGEVAVAGGAREDGTLELLARAPGARARPTLWVLERGASGWRRAPATEALAAPATLFAPARVTTPGAVPGGVTLGRDPEGNALVEIRKSWSTHVLARMAPDGRVLAQATLPERSIWKPLAGWTDKWVTSRGDVLEIHVGSRWLVVTRWAGGA